MFSFDQNTRIEKTATQTLVCQLSPTFINSNSCLTRTPELRKLSYKFSIVNSHQLACNSCSRLTRTIVEKTLIQTFTCQLSSTLMQLLFTFDQDMRVEKSLIQTLASQLSSTLIQLLFSFDQDTIVEKTLIQTLTCQLSSTLMQLLFMFDQDMRVEKSLIQTLASQLSSTLMQLLFSFDRAINS